MKTPPLVWGGLGLALALSPLPLPALVAQATDFDAAAPALQQRERGLPGVLPGTERWIVHFNARDFDLSRFRRAILDRRPADEVRDIVLDLEQRAERHQAPLVAEVQRLGGRLHAQWWIVNACCVDVPPAALDRLRGRDDVARLEPDRLAEPIIRRSTDAQNHNSDAANLAGFTGQGVASAVVDTGQDSDMNGTGRPHRTYYVNGDPNDNTGGGIGGSRLVINRQIGSMNADDVHNHGTGVASIVGGADWGTSTADDGHAPRAWIAGYAIANATNGNSSSSTMASAWQQVATDRAQFNIVSGNLSYSGSPSPSNVAQMALDSTQRNADVLVATAAGNSGTGGTASASSQGNANGLAVAAINADSHAMAGFSTRGPLSGNGRFFPDISGCGVSTVMARRNDESGNYTASGTSMASPQVCGAATLVRAANPQLTALEAKATLLATTDDIASANPSWDRNSFGLGMVRDDRAVALAQSGAGVGTGSVDSGNPTFSRSFPVTSGRFYSAVATWHRDPNLNTGYADLDLEVRDPSNTQLAISNTPLNLYEGVRFRAQSSGSVTVRVTAQSFQSGTSRQDFGFAFGEVPASPIAGSFTAFGQGCQGTGRTDPRCVTLNDTASLTSVQMRDSVGYAQQVTAPQALVVTGFEIHGDTRGFGSKTLTARIYAADGPGGAPGTVLGVGQLPIDGTNGWHRATLAAPVAISSGQTFFVFYLNDANAISQDHDPNGTDVDYFRLTGGVWGSRVTGRFAWAIRVLCQGGPGAVPLLSSNDRPEIGQPMAVDLTQAASNASSALLTGVSDQVFGSFTLPFDMGPLGAQNCFLLVSGDVVTSMTTNASGAASASFAWPNIRALVGRNVYEQAAVLDPGANTLGVAMTNGAILLIGGQP